MTIYSVPSLFMSSLIELYAYKPAKNCFGLVFSFPKLVLILVVVAGILERISSTSPESTFVIISRRIIEPAKVKQTRQNKLKHSNYILSR